LIDGLGLGTVAVLKLFIVAEAGSLGGGMLSCFGGCGGYSESRSFAACERLMLFFEVVLFHPKLSFLRREEVEEGVVGSSGLDNWVGELLFKGFTTFWARGPVNLGGLSLPFSTALNSPLVVDRGMKAYSPLDFGSELDTKGDTACLGLLDAVTGIVNLPLLTSRVVDESVRT
jgi:hypothetical protein